MKIIKNKNLSSLTSFKIGGKAKYFIQLGNFIDLKRFLNLKVKEDIFILGGGTNILINDFNGIVLKPNFRFIKEIENGLLEVGSGILVSELLDFAISKGYQGLEWAGGLPGTVGGGIEGGVGCFGGELKNLLTKVEAVNLKENKRKIFSKEECQLEYRNSFFKKNPEWLIISGTFVFNTGFNSQDLKKRAEEKINYRKEKHPLEFPNAGSVFKNYPFVQAPKFLQDLVLEKNKLKTDPFPIIPVAFLIAEAGLSGKRIGEAEISKKHSNFIINLGRATFNDVLSLIEYVEKRIEDKFQIKIEREIKIVDK